MVRPLYTPTLSKNYTENIICVESKRQKLKNRICGLKNIKFQRKSSCVHIMVFQVIFFGHNTK